MALVEAGKCGSCSAEINGHPALMCMTRLNTLPLNEAITVEPDNAIILLKERVVDEFYDPLRKLSRVFRRSP